MTPSQHRIVEEARRRFGPQAAVTETEAIQPWLTDWRGRYRGAAPALLQPGSTDEVAALVALAAAERVPLVAQGGNTSMVGGATPPAEGNALILSLRRLNRIRDVRGEDGIAVAEAGVILQTLHEAAAATNRRFPLTLGSRGSATIGGLVSTNAGGTQVLRWGTMKALVAGVEAVLADGTVHDGLQPLKKDNRGPDLNALFVGSEGTLGIVTAAALRIVPAVTARAVAWIGLDDPERALRLLRRLEAATDAVESFEIIPGDSLALVLRHIPGTRAPLGGSHPWHVLVEAVASEPAAEPPAALLERLLADAADLYDDATLAQTEAQAEAFWRLRDSLSEAERAEGPAAQHDISVPVAAMPRFMVEAAAAAEARFPGAHATAFGHLGDGNVHFHVRAPAGTDPARWYAEDVAGVSAFVHDLVVAAGGSISAEHGIGQMKRDELARLGPPARLNLLRALKAALDPHGLLNPGKLIVAADTPGAD